MIDKPLAAERNGRIRAASENTRSTWFEAFNPGA
jgi:hypothetical protein